ncbi:WD40 repeat domain-containing protein [Frankia sp. CiP3]|uniref:WD40 repeat domain-containing protein n=1 Tax=Frankia sp. CiP3 TaxID=2880971 RepID=UPI001EF426ED|nr:hypothetical protein [Frankia sp. CiP3]
MWDPRTGAQIAVLTGHTHPVGGLAVSPDGSWLATTGGDRTIRIFEPLSGRCAAAVCVDRPAHRCVWTSDRRLAAFDGPGGLYLFALVSGNHGATVTPPMSGAPCPGNITGG